MGKQLEGPKSSAPQWKFTTSDRLEAPVRLEDPFRAVPSGGKGTLGQGPGAYDTLGSCGRQIDGAFATQPIYGFGTLTRDAANKASLTEAQEKTLYGRQSPGPCAAYRIGGSMGHQTSSRYADQPVKRHRAQASLRSARLHARAIGTSTHSGPASWAWAGNSRALTRNYAHVCLTLSSISISRLISPLLPCVPGFMLQGWLFNQDEDKHQKYVEKNLLGPGPQR